MNVLSDNIFLLYCVSADAIKFALVSNHNTFFFTHGFLYAVIKQLLYYI